MTFDEIISRFEKPQRAGRGFKVRCPSHEDQKNSLSISEADNGKILLKCQAGCATKTVIDAVNLTWRDLAGSNENRGPSRDDPVVARYVYVDEQQKPLFRVCRTRSKDFFQEHFDSTAGRFIAGMNGTRRVLYHLPDILAAETVYIVEGEKDADKLASLKLAATTSPGGASKSEDKPKWNSGYSEYLKGKDIIIFPDNDEPGQRHAIAAARSVLNVARSVRVVCLPDLPPKGDVSDYLSSHSKEELLALVEGTAPFTGSVDLKGQTTLWPELLTAADILQAPKDPTRWVVEDVCRLAAVQPA